MYNLTYANNIIEIIFYALIINYLIMWVASSLYRYRKINKYHYDYYGIEKKSVLAKFSNNLVEVSNKIATLFYALLLLLIEVMLYYMIV